MESDTERGKKSYAESNETLPPRVIKLFVIKERSSTEKVTKGIQLKEDSLENMP